MDEKGSDVLQLSHAKHRKTAFQTSKCPESATPATRNGHSSSKNEHGSLVKRRLRKRENRAAHLVRACAVKSCRPDEQRPKGLIECLSHGFAYSQATCASTMVWMWDNLTRHLRDLNCPKRGFSARNCLRGRDSLTHGLTPCISHQNAYGTPAWETQRFAYAGQTAIWHSSYKTNEGFGPCSDHPDQTPAFNTYRKNLCGHPPEPPPSARMRPALIHIDPF